MASALKQHIDAVVAMKNCSFAFSFSFSVSPENMCAQLLEMYVHGTQEMDERNEICEHKIFRISRRNLFVNFGVYFLQRRSAKILVRAIAIAFALL